MRALGFSALGRARALIGSPSSARRARVRRVLAPFLPLALLSILATLTVLLSDRSPERLDLALSYAGPSLARPLGSGAGGTDLLPLVAHATLATLGLCAWVSALGWGLGTLLGTAAGLARGATERAVLAVCDLVQAFPSFLLALAVLAAVKVPSRGVIGVVFSLVAWAPFARLALFQARVLRSATFVEAARALGASPSRVLLGHVVPNLLGPVTVQLGTSAAGVVLGEAALGFIGLGPADGVSLGALLEQGVDAMLHAPHVLVVGAAAIALASGSLQWASEGLRRWACPTGR